MNPDFDVTVIGAGVIGLAVAREAALSGLSVVVLEKAARAGTETSARNSEVIHAGIYYPAGTLKAKLCVEGRTLLYDYCASHGVEARRLGKIIAATSAVEEAKLENIRALAIASGVADLEWLTPADVAELEPEITCTKALLSPSTGIVDASAFMLALQGEAEANGANFAFNTVFSHARRVDGSFVIEAGGVELKSTFLINCAGHGAHEVAVAVETYNREDLPPKFFARGSYCSVSGRPPFTHLIYPVPVTGALGIHATLDIGGAVRFGPDIQWIDELDYALPEGLPELFTGSIARYWPLVRDRELSPSYCGIRPKIHGPDTGFTDFLIQTEEQHGVTHLVNLFGIESPGLTASLAIARHILGKLLR